MMRHLITLLAAVSSVLCVAAVLLLITDHGQRKRVLITRSTLQVQLLPGGISMALRTAGPPLPSWTFVQRDQFVNRFYWGRAWVRFPNSFSAFLVASIPFFDIAIVTAVPPAVWLLIKVKRRKTTWPVDRCFHCGYDLRATPDRCPECGAFSDGAENGVFAVNLPENEFKN